MAYKPHVLNNRNTHDISIRNELDDSTTTIIRPDIRNPSRSQTTHTYNVTENLSNQTKKPQLKNDQSASRRSFFLEMLKRHSTFLAIFSRVK